MSAEALKISRQTGKALKEKNLTLAIAESCTGGYISHLVTSISGSSAYFIGSVIAYDNKVKTGVLGVKAGTIKKWGAVSSECAAEMAVGIRQKFNTDFALASTGIAGPTGAVKGKPVGTVYIALATKKGLAVERLQFKGSRKKIIEISAQKALEMLWMAL